MEKQSFPLSLALVDALPVLFFGAAAAILGVKLRSVVFIVGAALCLLAGAGKVVWKLLIALKGKDVAFLGAQLRYVMPAGFLLMMLGAFLAERGTLRTLLHAAVRLPSVLFFAFTLVGIVAMVVCAKKFSVMNKADMPVNSCLLSMGLSLVWMVVHYLCQSTGILGGSDVSEIAIMSSYLLYIPLYYVVFRLWRQKEIKNVFMGLIVPVLAVLGSCIAILGGLQNPLFIWYLLICGAMLLIAFVYYGKHKDDIHTV